MLPRHALEDQAPVARVAIPVREPAPACKRCLALQGRPAAAALPGSHVWAAYDRRARHRSVCKYAQAV